MLSLIANIEDLAVEKDKGCRYKFRNRGYETKAIIAEYRAGKCVYGASGE